MEQETRICKRCGEEKPITAFTKSKGTYNFVCQECANKHNRETRKKKKNEKTLTEELLRAKTMRLSEFTPRELMNELASRGYKGKLSFVQVQEIDIENF